MRACSEGQQSRLETICSAEIETGAGKLFAAEPEPPSAMFDHVYAAHTEN